MVVGDNLIPVQGPARRLGPGPVGAI